MPLRRHLLVLVLLLAAVPAWALENFATSELTILTAGGPQKFTIELALTNAQMEQGLMFRRSLAPDAGMLFDFKSPTAVSMWMKNTLIPLDMVFIASDGTVRRVFADVPVVPASTPDDRIPQEQSQARYVIELPAGEAAGDGIAAGVKLDLHGVADTPS
jgi:uncharacterized membrane protein (UPF0127 family)